MAIEIPAAPKVYTHVYDNFKGVDFTNDSTNVWHRRSPTGVNMLPDDAGTPFKRNGWDILLSNDDICTALGVASCSIKKLAYFELNGEDHIAIFTTNGVVFYNEENGVTCTSKDKNIIDAQDKCFFFEGNGTSAFYVYGALRIWRYEYLPEDASAVHGYVFHDVTDQAHIPTIVIGSTGGGAGSTHEAYNLLTDLASIEYSDYDLFYYYGNDGCYFTVDEEKWKADITNYVKGDPTTYTWTYNGSSWDWSADYTPQRGAPPFNANGVEIIKVNNPKVGDTITVLYGVGMMLPVNIAPPTYDYHVEVEITEDEFDADKEHYFYIYNDAYKQCKDTDTFDPNETYYIIVYKDVRVFVSQSEQFDTEMDVQPNYTTLRSGNCCVVIDESGRSHPQAHIEFALGDAYNTSDGEFFKGQDTIKVIFPTRDVVSTEQTYSATGTAIFVGEVVT